MKTKILTIALLAATLGCYATPIDEAPSTPPTHVITQLNELLEWHGDISQDIDSKNVNPVTNEIISKVSITPFECPPHEFNHLDIKEAFKKDLDLCYQSGLYEPGQKGLFVIYTGDTQDKFVNGRDREDQGYYYMCCINPDNPRLRDFYAVLWEEGDNIKGKIFLITSLRPDLMEKGNKSYSFSFSSSNGGPDISILGVDTCFAEPNISKYLQGLEKYVQGMEIYKNDMEKFRKDMSKLPDGLNFSKDMAGWSPAAMTKQNSIEKQLNAYKQLLEMQQDQINTLEQQYKDNVYNLGERRHINKRLRKLHKQAQKTTDKMEKLIKKIRY